MLGPLAQSPEGRTVEKIRSVTGMTTVVEQEIAEVSMGACLPTRSCQPSTRLTSHDLRLFNYIFNYSKKTRGNGNCVFSA